MSLNIIGLGLSEKSVSLEGLELIKKSDFVYLDCYTSKFDFKKFGKFVNKKIILADRDLVEKSDEILENSKKKEVSFLVVGEVFSATTHISLFLEAKKKGIKVRILNNASILTAVGVTGLDLYRFGRVASIPFENKNVKVPYEIFKENYKLGLHTLFLLDLNKDKFMSINEGLEYLVNQGLNKDLICVGCCKLGNEDFEIKKGKVRDLLKYKFKKFPQCFILIGKLHFMEEEVLELWK